MSYRVLDLFCGCGGFTSGLVSAGFTVIAGIDVWEPAIQSYQANFPEHLALCADLRTLSPEQFYTTYLSKKLKKDEGIDVIVGGPPCQGFSNAGKRAPDDPRNSLFMNFAQYLSFFKPKAFLMENVIGILSAKTPTGKKAIEEITEVLSEGYNIVISKLYASDFGVPQNRRRVIIIGIRKDLFIAPTEPTPLYPLKDRPAVGAILLPKEEVGKEYYLSSKALEGIKRRKEQNQKAGKGFGAQFLDLAKPCYTISARYWKDGYDALVKYSEEEVRRLTLLELKRVQGLPDNFLLRGTKQEQYTQLGNAVAGKFSYYLGLHLLKVLEEC